MVLDRLIPFCCSRPQTLQARSCGLYLPTTEAAFAFGEDVHGPNQNDVYHPKANISRLGILPFYITTIMMWGKLTALYFHDGRKTATKSPSDPTGIFFQTEQELQHWYESMPIGLQWSVENYRSFTALGQAKIFVNLHFLIRHCFCVANQEYLPQNDVPSYASAATDLNVDAAGRPFDFRDERLVSLCVENARGIADIAFFLSSGELRDRELLQSTFAGCAIMTAASVFLWAQYVNDASNQWPERAKAKETFEFLKTILRQWRREWKIAHAWTETLSMLHKLYDCVYTDAIEVVDEQASSEPDDTAIGATVGAPPSPPRGRSEVPISHGTGLPDPTTICQRLYYKIRTITVLSMEASDSKREILEVFIQRLKENMWFNEAMKNFGSDLAQFPADLDSFTT